MPPYYRPGMLPYLPPGYIPTLPHWVYHRPATRTGVPGHMVHHAQCPGREALGSAREYTLGERLSGASLFSFLLGLLGSDAQDPSALPRIKWIRLDRRRVFPRCFPLWSGYVAQRGSCPSCHPIVRECCAERCPILHPFHCLSRKGGIRRPCVGVERERESCCERCSPSFCGNKPGMGIIVISSPKIDTGGERWILNLKVKQA